MLYNADVADAFKVELSQLVQSYLDKKTCDPLAMSTALERAAGQTEFIGLDERSDMRSIGLASGKGDE